jgi:formylglycine-generating enzyme required for sulfatase activity
MGRKRIVQAILILVIVAAVTLLITAPASSDIKLENNLLRWLDTSGDYFTLAETLDRLTSNIPAGEFIMGSNTGKKDELPEHKVYLDAYAIDRYEVTNAQYSRFIHVTGHKAPAYWNNNDYPSGQALFPVVEVNWEYANAYCHWRGKRLPSEAEWEKACRGSEGFIYPWGNSWNPAMANIGAILGTPDPLAWEKGVALLNSTNPISGQPALRPVGSYFKGASPYGVMDMEGNASEWVLDYYNWDGYWNVPAKNPVVMEPPWNHSFRGSSWYEPYGSAGWMESLSRCPARNSSHDIGDDPRAGFRCARSLQ